MLTSRFQSSAINLILLRVTGDQVISQLRVTQIRLTYGHGLGVVVS